MIRHISEDPSRLDSSIGEVMKKHLINGPKGNSELCFTETLNVPLGECYTSRLKNRKQNDLLDGYGGFAHSISGSQTELSCRNDTITVFFFAANKKWRQ